MSIQNYFSGKRKKQAQRGVPLRLILVIPFVLQLFGAVGVTAYFSFRNSHHAIDNLARQLQQTASQEIEVALEAYLKLPVALAAIDADAIDMGLINVRDFQTTGKFFWKQMKTLKNIGFLSYALESGEYLGAGRWLEEEGITIDETSAYTNWESLTYATNPQGDRLEVIDDSAYDPFGEPWYSETVAAQKPIWNQVYAWDGFPQIQSVAFSRPIFDDHNKVIGVLSVDLLLSGISQFLAEQAYSPSAEIFIMERNGALIASSTSEPLYNTIDDQIQRRSIHESTSPTVQAALVQLRAKIKNWNEIEIAKVFKFDVEKAPQYAQITPWKDGQGLDWLILITVPESDFMAEINANRELSLFFCLVALGIAIILGMLTSRWITQPLQNLRLASQAIASGEMSHSLPQSNIKEVQGLSQAFNTMVFKLKHSLKTLEQVNDDLEARVKVRTVELQVAKEAADSANQAKSQFLANMSHELRTPLNGILGYAQILQREGQTPGQYQDGLNTIYQCGNHLLNLINEVLDLSKIEAQKLEISLLPFDFHPFLDGVREMCRLKADQKGIGFKYEVAPNLPFVIVSDEKRLRQVLLNLLGNAIKFTNSGSVVFSVEALDDPPTTLRFKIQDTGIGMQADQVERIFQPFEQLGEHQQKSEGTGLGLAISQQITKLLGTKIEVKSQLGYGSTFWFDLGLPNVQDPQSSSSEIRPPKIVGYEGDRKTILIVDDQWQNRALVNALLTPLGFRMIEAENGQKGLTIAKMTNPDLIITDLKMPLMDGFTMTRKLRSIQLYREKVIIASSASVFSFDRDQSQAAGCNGFLAKPIELEALISILAQHLNLCWRYADSEPKHASETKSSPDASPTAQIPPPQELAVLYQAAKAGYIAEIQAEAQRIKQLHGDYASFSNHILELAATFDDEAIVTLVKSYLS